MDRERPQQQERAQAPGGPRVERRARTWLPTGRAVVGGVLVATAATGVLLAHRAAGDLPSTRYVVATADLPAGSVIGAGDLGTIAADLPDDVTAVDEADATDMVGRVTRVPVAAMDLLRPGDVHEPGRFPTADTTEVAVDLPPAQALSGTLRAGDRVRVLSTDAAGAGTTTIAEDVFVSQVGVDDAAGGIGSDGDVRVRLALPDPATAQQVVDAAVRTEITLALPAPSSVEAGAEP